MPDKTSTAENSAVAIHIEPVDVSLDRATVSRHKSLGESVQSVETDCAYTVAHTLAGRRVVRFERHLKRLFESARHLGYEPGIGDVSIRRLLCDALERYGWERSRFRITLLREGGLIIAIEPYSGVPLELRSRGVDCALAPHAARDAPDTKTTSWMAARSSLSHRRVYEVLLCDEGGFVLEGSSSNVFFVAGESQTPVLRTAEKGILKGVTRAIVLELAETKARDIDVQRAPVHISELEHTGEAFICSSTRGVVPIRRIDDRIYTAPGACTSRISQLYDEWVEAHAEPLLP